MSNVSDFIDQLKVWGKRETGEQRATMAELRRGLQEFPHLAPYMHRHLAPFTIYTKGWQKQTCLDLRQPRGWDWMSTLYPANSCFLEMTDYNEQKENTDRNNRLLETAYRGDGADNKFVRKATIRVLRRFFEDVGGDA